MKKILTTKIITGIYKNRVLQLPSLDITRSSKNIVKESLFNTLQFDIVDSIFFELFAGSGSIGLEALSRGAKQIYFIEKNRNSFKILNENINSINREKCQSFNGDTFEEFRNILKNINESTYFYIDPPFAIREGFEDIYNKIINLIESIPKELVKMVIIEHHSDIKFETINNFEKLKTKKFGKTSLTYFK